MRGGGGLFFRWRGGGASFLSGGGGGGGHPMGALILVGGFQKNFKMGRGASPMPPTMGNPSVSILLVRYPIITTELFIAR